MKKNITNIKSSDSGISDLKARSRVNNFNLVYNKAFFLPFIQSPISDVLDFNEHSDGTDWTSWSAADDNNEVNISFEREKNSEPNIKVLDGVDMVSVGD